MENYTFEDYKRFIFDLNKRLKQTFDMTKVANLIYNTYGVKENLYVVNQTYSKYSPSLNITLTKKVIYNVNLILKIKILFMKLKTHGKQKSILKNLKNLQ